MLADYLERGDAIVKAKYNKLILVQILLLCVVFFAACTNMDRQENENQEGLPGAVNEDQLDTEIVGSTKEDLDDLSDNGIEKSTKDARKPYLIGVTLASSEASYINTLEGYIKEYANEESIKLIVKNASWDTEVQESHMDEFIALGVDAIILSPVNIKSMLLPLINAYNKKIPVININMKVDAISTEYITTYIGSSSSEQAKLAASLFTRELEEGGGKIGIIEGSPGSDPQIYRTNAFINQLLMYPQIEIVEVKDGKWDRNQAYIQALELLYNHPDLKGIYCHDSNMAMGAIQAIEKLDMVGRVMVVGISEGKEYENAVKEGKLYGFITQPAEYEAKTSVYCAIEAIKGETLRPWYKDPIEVVTYENVDDFVKGKNLN